MTTFQSNSVLYAAQLNGAFAEKADLDAVTGKVKADQLPDLAAIADERLDVRLPPIAAEIQSAADAAAAAQSAADGAAADAAAAQAAASVADGKADDALTAANQASDAAAGALAAAAAAQSAADGKIPLSQKGVANGVASLGNDGLVPASQLPAMGGGGSEELRAWINFSPATGVIRAHKNISFIQSDPWRAWYINFVTPMPDANFAAVYGGKFDSNAGDTTIAVVSEPRRNNGPTRGTGFISAIANFHNGGAGLFDAFNIETISVAVFR